MNAAKKKRLEAAGWKETTVKEFLNLSDADVYYIAKCNKHVSPSGLAGRKSASKAPSRPAHR
jgi:hypothetical protein